MKTDIHEDDIHQDGHSSRRTFIMAEIHQGGHCYTDKQKII
jgi:hypothetical protein